MSDSLAIYLHDHYAGSHFAVELLHSLEEQYSAEPLGDFAHRICQEIEQDQHTLQHIIDTVGKTHLDAAEALGWLSEKVGQFKLQRGRGGGLGSFQALETLALGIQGKLSLWRALPNIRQFDGRIPEIDFAALQARAQTQYEQVEDQRLQLAAEAFRRAV
ncbi:MAG TPA: hypothetical protein VHC90_07035 [Bryobacteraceae bacterium]|nr:hypothetical protein [Bryobacteraceae bacterium]